MSYINKSRKDTTIRQFNDAARQDSRNPTMPYWKTRIALSFYVSIKTINTWLFCVNNFLLPKRRVLLHVNYFNNEFMRPLTTIIYTMRIFNECGLEVCRSLLNTHTHTHTHTHRHYVRAARAGISIFLQIKKQPNLFLVGQRYRDAILAVRVPYFVSPTLKKNKHGYFYGRHRADNSRYFRLSGAPQALISIV
jgi:hypothetical protein